MEALTYLLQSRGVLLCIRVANLALEVNQDVHNVNGAF